MESWQKLQSLSEASLWETGEDGCRKSTGVRGDGIILTRACLPNGRTTTLLKSLLSSACEKNCLYCPMRAGRDFRRHSFSPDEFAHLVSNLTRAGLIQGVFLSSGVAGSGVRTQDRLIDTAQILRTKYGYHGYLHLKIMPGAQDEQILTSMRLADRVSINLEAPNDQRLPLLAPQKDFNSHLMRPLEHIAHIRRSYPPRHGWGAKWPSISTQFVMGAAGESDRELLRTTQFLHRDYQLSRAYFSAFTPLADTPMANHPPVPCRRELRLYQADFLIRDYGFDQEELIFDEQDNLVGRSDPKTAWAERHLRWQPVEINRASREELLRVPGIGPKSAQRIIHLRRKQTLRELGNLRRLGINVQRAQNFILLNGHQPASQMPLF